MRGFPLTLKLTTSIDIVKPFEAHIKKRSGKDAVAPVRPTLEEMEKMRSHLDFNKMKTLISSDPSVAADFELQIINYLRYVYLIDNFFKADFPNSKTLKLDFPWNDSFQPKKVKAINHIKYELVSCLYNLAICYYTEGLVYTANSSVQEKLKGIGKLRVALWCVDEIRQCLPALLSNPSEIPSDLTPSYINCLYNYIIALTYATLADITGADTKKNGPEKIASINKAASKYFQTAYNIIVSVKPSPLPDTVNKSFKMNLVYNTVMFKSEALYQMAQVHLAKVDEEVRQGHMGLAVSYLRRAKFDFDEILKNKSELDFLTPEQKSAFIERSKLIISTYDNCLLKNQRVYQQPEYNYDQLPEIPDEKTAIVPIEAKDIKKKLEAERFFEIFLSPEILMLKNDFINAVNIKMFETENSLKNANNVKSKLYSEGYVNYLLDLQTQSGKKVDIPPQLKAKIDKFKKNGAINAYQYTRKNIQELSAACAKMLQEVKDALAAEKADDENVRRQYPSQWTRPYSEQVSQEYVCKLRDLEQKFYIAQNTDKEAGKKFNQFQDWMQKLSLPDDQILTLIPKNNDPEFLEQIKPKLAEIMALDSKIVNLADLEKQRNNLILITEAFLKNDFISSFSAIHAKSVDKQAEFDKIMAPYKAQLAEIESQINEAYPLMEHISSQSKSLVGPRANASQNGVKVLEEINLAIGVINDLFNDFQQALAFYGNLQFHLNSLQKVVSDFCFAREVEKSCLLQEFQAQNGAANINANLYPDPSAQTYNKPMQQNQQAYNPQQMYQPPVQNQNQPYYQQPQGQYQYQGQNQQQTQAYNPGNQQYQGNNNQQVTGYLPLGQPDSQGGAFQGFGNLVESTFINPNQRKGPNNF